MRILRTFFAGGEGGERERGIERRTEREIKRERERERKDRAFASVCVITYNVVYLVAGKILDVFHRCP